MSTLHEEIRSLHRLVIANELDEYVFWIFTMADTPKTLVELTGAGIDVVKERRRRVRRGRERAEGLAKEIGYLGAAHLSTAGFLQHLAEDFRHLPELSGRLTAEAADMRDDGQRLARAGGVDVDDLGDEGP